MVNAPDNQEVSSANKLSRLKQTLTTGLQQAHESGSINNLLIN